MKAEEPKFIGGAAEQDLAEQPHSGAHPAVRRLLFNRGASACTD